MLLDEDEEEKDEKWTIMNERKRDDTHTQV